MKLQIVTIISLLTSTSLLAHGMNKLGPNGGYIRMPGVFHTEIVEKNNSFHVYILDINFKNPTTENYQLAISAGNNIEQNKKCLKQNDNFVCEKLSGIKDAKSLTISITKGTNSTKANYEYPFKLK